MNNEQQESPKKVVVSLSTVSVVKTLLIVGAAFLLVYLINVVLIILTAVVIASAVEPGIRWMAHRRVPRVLGAILIYTSLLSIIAGMFYFIVPIFVTELANFVMLLPEKITALNLRNSGFGGDLFGLNAVPPEGSSVAASLGQTFQNIATGLSTSAQSVFGSLSAIFGGVISFFFIGVLSFYLAVQESGVEDFIRLISPLKHESYIVGLWRRTQYKIGRWIQGQFILAIIVGILVYIGLSFLNVPNALLLALVSTVFEVIPVFGPFIAAVPGGLIAFTHGGFPLAIVVLIMYTIVQQIESNIIYPLVIKKVLDVPPLVVMISLIAGAKLGGFLGILLSVPIAAALTEYLGDVGKKRVIARAKMSDDNS